MPTRPRRPPIAGLRRLLLLALVVGLAVVVVVFVVRRSGAPQPGSTPDGGPRPEGEITLIGEGFEFTQSEGERPVFRIRGESIKVRRGSEVLLEDVGLTLYDEEGTPYHVEAEEASYDQESRDASLMGSMRLMGPDGMVLTSQGMTLRNHGTLAQSRGPVEMLYGGLYRGTADRFVGRLNRNIFALAGRASVTRMDAGAAATLRASTITYEREKDFLYALDRAVLRRGRDRLNAERINLHLDPEGRIVMARARGEVAGRIRLGPRAPAAAEAPPAPPAEDADLDDADDAGDADRTPSTVRVRGDSLVVEFAEDGTAERADLEGLPGAPASLIALGAGGLDQTLTAARIEARNAGGGHQVIATGSPRLIETAAGAPAEAPPLRRVAARRLTSSLDAAGDVRRFAADGEVEYRAPDLEARGEHMTWDGAAATADLRGDPVRVVSERGELLAPHVVYEQEQGLLWAEGGTRAVLAEGSGVGLEGSPLGSGEGPVRVEAERAYWRDEPASALFRGDVRAWRGKSLLVAAELRGDREDGAEVLRASGGVKTVWTGRAGPGGEGSGGEDLGRPVEITARTMEYRRPEGTPRGTVVYEGEVASRQGERTLACRTLEVELDDDGRAETMTCTGAVRLEDRAAGNVATGERAVYDLAARTVDMTGDPVVLTRRGDGEAGRSEVRGRRVLYEVDAGRARVLAGGEGTATPTTTPAPPPAEGGG